MHYNFGPDIYLCEKGDTSLTAPVIPGAVYQWNDDSLTTTPVLKITKTGVYTVKMNGCAVTDSIGIFYSNLPDIKLGDDHVMCAGETSNAECCYAERKLFLGAEWYGDSRSN